MTKIYSEHAALEALKSVRDPKSGRDIISAGLLADMAYKDRIVRAVLMIAPHAASANVAAYEAMRRSAETVLASLAGVELAQVILTSHKEASPQEASPQEISPQGGASSGFGQKNKGVRPHQSRRTQGYQGDRHIRRLIAVSSAKGGVGKSTVAINLAATLAKLGYKTGVLDADIHGPSLPHLVGMSGTRAKTTEREGRRLIVPVKAYGLKTMSIGYLADNNDPLVWRGPMVQGAMAKMLWDVDWGELDYLIVDMPPGTGDAQLGLAQDLKPHSATRGAIIVSTPQDLALIDARKGAAMFAKVDVPVLGFVENMSVFICPDCGASHALFGGGAQAEAVKMGIDFLGAIPLEMPIRESGDRGEPIACGDTLSAKAFTDIGEKLMRRMQK